MREHMVHEAQVAARALKLAELRLKSVALAFASGAADLADVSLEAIHYAAAVQRHREVSILTQVEAIQ
jgi:hypothetical protein